MSIQFGVSVTLCCTPMSPALPTPADPFATLNPEQRAAVEHGLDGDTRPLLVIAGAGSGKTMTLAARVARLVLAGADPHRVLLLTFSRRAAAEMTRRAGRLLHQALGLRATQAPPAFAWAGTFHAVGARLLRDHAAQIGLPDTFTLLDRADAEDLMGLAREAAGFAKSAQRFPLKGTCLSIYSRVVNSRAPLRDVLAEVFPWCRAWEAELKALFQAYVAAKQSQHVLDYDDLLLYWAQMMGDAGIAAAVGARFDHVLVDEYQDTNRLQAEILCALKPDGRGLTVVGDDAQAIYGFRAAEVRNILDFPTRFSPPARLVALERNYRSTAPILDAANAVIALAPERHTKTLWTDRASSARPQLVTVTDESAQAAAVADEVLEQRERGIALKRQAVLFRAAHHSAPLELELARRNIPFVKFGGLKFLEAAHVKDVLSVLRWAQNPRSRLAGFRIAQRVAGIGPASARRLLDTMVDAAAPADAFRAFKPPPAAREDWSRFADTWLALHARTDWPADLDTAVAWYGSQLDRLYEDAAVRRADLAQLQALAAGFGSRDRFLTDLTLDPPEATSAESGPPHRDEDYLVLSTIHAAKGQEWHSVQVLNVVDGCIPSDMATGHAAEIEEERRLLYVAVTRAQHALRLLVPQRFHITQQTGRGDRHVYASLSRFIPPEVAAQFEAVGITNAIEATPTAPAIPQVDIAARIKSMWD